LLAVGLLAAMVGGVGCGKDENAPDPNLKPPDVPPSGPHAKDPGGDGKAAKKGGGLKDPTKR